jgi:hypothetical protein
MKILALNSMEEKKKRIMERVLAKYSDKDRVPTAYERFVWLVNFLFPYFKTLKIIMTVITPSKNLQITLSILLLVLILIWYTRNLQRVSRSSSGQGCSGRWNIFKDLEKDNMFYISKIIDLILF